MSIARQIAEQIDGNVQALLSALEHEIKKQLAPPALSRGFRLGERSLRRLQGVHPDLLAVVQYAIRVTPVDFGIPATGGVRSRATQQHLVADGKSGTTRSRHLTGHAVDIYAYVDGKASWQPKHVLAVHDAFEVASAALEVPLRWGGDWDGDGDVREPGENDLVHHELPRRAYGNDPESQSAAAAEFLASIQNGV